MHSHRDIGTLLRSTSLKTAGPTAMLFSSQYTIYLFTKNYNQPKKPGPPKTFKLYIYIYIYLRECVPVCASVDLFLSPDKVRSPPCPLEPLPPSYNPQRTNEYELKFYEPMVWSNREKLC